MTIPTIDPAYLAKLNDVGRCLYSLDFHFCRWEDATEAEREKYRHKAHLARVWWQLAQGQPPTQSVSESRPADLTR